MSGKLPFAFCSNLHIILCNILEHYFFLMHAIFWLYILYLNSLWVLYLSASYSSWYVHLQFFPVAASINVNGTFYVSCKWGHFKKLLLTLKTPLTVKGIGSGLSALINIVYHDDIVLVFLKMIFFCNQDVLADISHSESPVIIHNRLLVIYFYRIIFKVS